MRAIVTTTSDNALLRKKAEAVPVAEISSPRIQQIIKDMSEALRATVDGIGIAAPQIGESLRIFIASEEAVALDPTTKTKAEWLHWVFINPEITSIALTTEEDSEGCLSVPGTFGITKRAEKATIRAFNEHGQAVERSATGLLARLFQHEVDHLNGKLFIDHATDLIQNS